LPSRLWLAGHDPESPRLTVAEPRNLVGHKRRPVAILALLAEGTKSLVDDPQGKGVPTISSVKAAPGARMTPSNQNQQMIQVTGLRATKT